MEASMQEYEIRILRADRSTAAVIEVTHLNDGAAIQSARRIADARPFEVWRGLDCVYGREAPPWAAREPSTQPAA
jgi:hypothetical protein